MDRFSSLVLNVSVLVGIISLIVHTEKGRIVRKIFALEATWFKNSHISIKPLLDILWNDDKVSFWHYVCDTKDQLSSSLSAVADEAKSGDILYIATHGFPGGLGLKKGKTLITLDELSEMMGKSFSGCIAYLSGCSTLRFPITDFIKKTGVSCVCGYVVDVEWVIGGALDMLMLYEMQKYKKMRWFYRGMKKQYFRLMRNIGFDIVFP